jgi:hypothetical protein
MDTPMSEFGSAPMSDEPDRPGEPTPVERDTADSDRARRVAEFAADLRRIHEKADKPSLRQMSMRCPTPTPLCQTLYEEWEDASPPKHSYWPWCGPAVVTTKRGARASSGSMRTSPPRPNHMTAAWALGKPCQTSSMCDRPLGALADRSLCLRLVLPWHS